MVISPTLPQCVSQFWDAFDEIARNEKDVTIYVQDTYNLLDTCTFSSIARVMNRHRKMGKRPICIYIGISPANMIYWAKDTKLNLIKYTHTADVLATILDVGKHMFTYMDTNTVISMPYTTDTSVVEVNEWQSVILPHVLSKVSQDDRNICMIVSPYLQTVMGDTRDLLDMISNDLPELRIQYIHPDSYTMVGIATEAPSPNQLLFPSYDISHYCDNMLEHFPGVCKDDITKDMWNYHKMVYNVDGATGTQLVKDDGARPAT